jgi:bifunctional oligoribonuclease and PAP phosphatase NrnA
MLQNARALLESANRFVLTTHTRPDGDAIGSVLAFAHYLRKKGKEVAIINCDPAPFNLEWLPGSDQLTVFDGGLSHLQTLADADVVAVMDANSAGRLGRFGASVKKSAATKMLVDHHTAPEDWFDVSYTRESASSTGELVFELIESDDLDLLDYPIAACLYAAIATDTGSFRYSNVTPKLHRLIADLIERGGLDSSVIHANIWDRKSIGGLHLLSRLLQSLQLSHGGQVAHSIISRAMLQECGASIEETDGYVNWGLSIEGVRVTILFTETERGTKASFRSKGDDHVHKWAQALGGGGHPNASGAFLRKPLDETIRKVLSQAPRFMTLSESGTTDELSQEDRDYLSMLQTRPRRAAGHL